MKESINPYSPPVHIGALTQRIRFDADPERLKLRSEFLRNARKSTAQTTAKLSLAEHDIPPSSAVPSPLRDWLNAGTDGRQITFYDEREIQVSFEADETRLHAWDDYLEQWHLWAERVKPHYRSNSLYDQLYNVHLRLSVKGDKLELLAGNMFLCWGEVFHPLILTRLELLFDPAQRLLRLPQLIPVRDSIWSRLKGLNLIRRMPFTSWPWP